MNKCSFYLSFLISTIAFSNFTHAAASNLYIHIKYNSIEIGEYSQQNLKAVPYKNYTLKNIDPEEISGYLIGNKEENILYYIHCWLGNYAIYNKSSIRRLQELRGFDRMITIKWEGQGLRYIENWFYSIEEGRKISQLMEYLLSIENKRNVLLCHSMGHRVFQGIFENLKKDRKYFKLIIFASADLQENILNSDLMGLPSMTDKILVYTHQDDRLLFMAMWLLREKRLGRINTKALKIYQHIPNITFTDITSWPKNKFSPTNHIYFKDHHGVMEDMNRWSK